MQKISGTLSLIEYLRDDLGVEPVLDERGVEEGEDAEELVQRLLRVHVRRRVQVAVAARGQPSFITLLITMTNS